MCKKTIAVCNQKGGVGKTTTAIAFGAGLSMKGYRVLMVDCDDANASLTKALVTDNPLDLKCSLVDLMLYSIMGRPLEDSLEDAIYHHSEGFDILPATNKLAGITTFLNSQQSVEVRNNTLNSVISMVKDSYDYIIIDAASALNTLSVNIITACDEILIVSHAADSSEKAIPELLDTAMNIMKSTGKKISIAGILITTYEGTTRVARNTRELIREKYKSAGIRVYNTAIPKSVKGIEFTASKKSILEYAPKSKVAEAYLEFTDEYMEV